MGKRRTKEDKKNAKYPFLVNWDPDSSSNSSESKKDKSEPSVKGQFKNKQKNKPKKNRSEKMPKAKAKLTNLASTKKDIFKSIGLAGLIVGLELMLYLLRSQ